MRPAAVAGTRFRSVSPPSRRPSSRAACRSTRRTRARVSRRASGRPPRGRRARPIRPPSSRARTDSRRGAAPPTDRRRSAPPRQCRRARRRAAVRAVADGRGRQGRRFGCFGRNGERPRSRSRRRPVERHVAVEAVAGEPFWPAALGVEVGKLARDRAELARGTRGRASRSGSPPPRRRWRARAARAPAGGSRSARRC